VLLLAFVRYQHTSIWKTVLRNLPGGIGVFNVQQWLQRLTFYGNWAEQLYSVQPLPSCATVSINAPFNKSLHHNSGV